MRKVFFFMFAMVIGNSAFAGPIKPSLDGVPAAVKAELVSLEWVPVDRTDAAVDPLEDLSSRLAADTLPSDGRVPRPSGIGFAREAETREERRHSVPEPASLLLVSLGFLGLAAGMRRRIGDN